MAVVLIVGANRGIGLELCRQYHERGDTVFGTCRRRNDAINSAGVRVIENIDVTDDASVDQLPAAIDAPEIDVMINNAGILRGDRLDNVDFSDMAQQYQVNTIGPLRVVRAVRSKLQQGAKVGLVTSRVGSIEDNSSGNNYGYRCSKAAANMVGKNLQHDLAPAGIAVALLHPGLVATDMTGGRGISPAEAAGGLIARMDELSMHNTGRFWHAEGYELPW